MATDWNGVKIKCPFCKGAKHEGKGGIITCGGIIEDSELDYKLAKKADYDIQLNGFCCGKFKNCEIYRMKCGIYGYED